jgi:hypothetical protein
VPPRRAAGGYRYAPVPSLAGRISSARRRFIELTDRTCAVTYASPNAAARAMRAAQGDPDLRADAYLEAHTDQLRAIEDLGPPPDGVASHRRWLDNFRERVRLEGELLRRLESGALEEADAIDARIGRLKLAGNTMGQRFGLRICTSNGPDRTPVPR